ncbi:hypothetical protein CLU79DRAFT_116763 [Phycomyces nitens]|nr:hypothetical protein CLU79DRAFT_116763 [Phycomyces nitens]
MPFHSLQFLIALTRLQWHHQAITTYHWHHICLMKGQVTVHTNFRIDNIKPSTRFSELPDAAQKELDELEKYVRGESQRCDYLMNHSGPQHAKMMETTESTISSLNQQLEAMSIGLKRQLVTAESLFETAKEQLRHAADGRAVIEVCKNPGSNARWLFGYSPEDDYFVTLAKQLTNRCEEYKRCILEIERTTESWAENKAQSPQDIARIIKAQNQTFLALSSRVASLHENIEKQKAYYAQYQRLYS